MHSLKLYLVLLGLFLAIQTSWFRDQLRKYVFKTKNTLDFQVHEQLVTASLLLAIFMLFDVLISNDVL